MSNPLTKKGKPSFDKVTNGKNKKDKEPENHEQLEHPATKDIPETGTNVNSNVGTGIDISNFLDDKPEIKKKQVSIYLDTDVIDAFNEWGKTQKKGDKSELVNNFLKQVFNIRQGEK